MQTKCHDLRRQRLEATQRHGFRSRGLVNAIKMAERNLLVLLHTAFHTRAQARPINVYISLVVLYVSVPYILSVTFGFRYFLFQTVLQGQDVQSLSTTLQDT